MEVNQGGWAGVYDSENRVRELGLLSLERGLRGEQVLSSIPIERPEVYFPGMHSKRMKSYRHSVQEGEIPVK